jgi:hypothetical protein
MIWRGQGGDCENPKMSYFGRVIALHSEKLKLDQSCGKLDSWEAANHLDQYSDFLFYILTEYSGDSTIVTEHAAHLLLQAGHYRSTWRTNPSTLYE